MKKHCLTIAVITLAWLAAGCVGLEEMVANDPVAAIKSVGRVGKAVVNASQDITEEQEIYLGRSVSARILAQYPMLDNAYLTKYINMVGTTVAMVSERPDLPFHFAVLNTEEVNAFAAPGGYIFITRGMLKSLKNEDELAAILAHEIGHVCAKHSLKSIKNELWKKVVMITAREAAQSQGVNPELLALFGEATENIVGTLITSGYSKPMEYEADKLGQRFAGLAGYDAGSLKQYIQVMTEHEKNNDRNLGAWLGTHPSFEDRLTKLPKTSAGRQDAKASEFRAARFVESTRL